MDVGKTAGKKAGALNKAFFTLDPEGWDFVLQMDGDTHLALDLVEEAMDEFSRNKRLGGVCSRCLVQPLFYSEADSPAAAKKKYSFWNRLWWSFQNIEYSMGDSRNVQRDGAVKVLAGAVTLYRMRALQQVVQFRLKCDGLHQVWKEDHLVEDYVLTLDVRELGYEARAGRYMFAYTGVPLTRRDLQQQRDRWYSGTLRHFIERGFTRETQADILGQIVRFGMMIAQIAYIGVVIYILTLGSFKGLRPHPLALIVLAASLIDAFIRFKYIRNPDNFQRLIVFSLLPWWAYSLWDDYLVFRSYFLCFRGVRKW